MSSIVYLKETTEIETKIVEIPDHTSELEELQKKTADQALHSAISKKRIENTAAGPFEQMTIYLSELVKPFLIEGNTPTKDLQMVYCAFKVEPCVDDYGDPALIFGVCANHYDTKGYSQGWQTHYIGTLTNNGYVFHEDRVPTDNQNIQNLLNGWYDFKTSYEKRLNASIIDRNNKLNHINNAYNKTIEMIDNFIV